MTDIQKALQGDHEAAKRLTEEGVLLPCPFCGGDTITTNLLGEWWCRCMGCDATGPIRADEDAARLAWNTRAAVEVDNGKENP